MPYKLDTPALLLDIDLFEENLIKMRDFAAKADKKLRPHAKTHKCPEIARRQMAAGNAIGICAAKLTEAEKLAEAGLQSILITSPVTAPWKIERIAALNEKISGLQLTVDNQEQLKMLAAQGTQERPVHVLVDVDPEMGRTGVPFDDAVAFGRLAASYPTLVLDGVQCYTGHLQHIPEFAQRAAESKRLMKKGAAVFNALKQEFSSCKIFTGTGTGTSPADLMIPELTDIQVGSYCMMDAEYLGVEHGGPSYAPALRILTSIISSHKPGEATIDAGTKSIYVTPGAQPLLLDGNRIRKDCRYSWDFGDEHGHLYFPECEMHLPGEQMEMIVSHCDPTVNLFDTLWIVRCGEIIDKWDISLRGCCQ